MKKKIKVSKILLIPAMVLIPLIATAQIKPIKNIDIRIIGTNLTYKAVFDQIEKQSGYSIDFNMDVIDLTKKVPNIPKAGKLDVFLKQLLKEANCTYEISNGHIILKSLKENTVQKGKSTHKISGVVTDPNNKSIIGASVMIEGQNKGTVTDMNGHFTMDVPEGGKIKISYIGYLPQIISTDNKDTFRLMLQEDNQKLNEVVVVGYGTQKKIDLTGSVASVNGDLLVKRPVTNPVSMLEGNLAGVQIVQNSGEPGNEGLSIRIRGIGTFSSAGSNPLILIDGVAGSLTDVDPNNIENVSVLKDAASASIYGSRAANGVILVTTKTGKEGKISLMYNGNFALHTPTRMYKLITNSSEYMELYNEARVNSGYTPQYTQDMIDSYKNATDKNLYPNTDWLSLIFRTAQVQTHNLTFSGGNKDTKFNVSLGYVDQDGIMKGFSYKKYNGLINISSNINNKIKFGAKVSIKKGDYEGPRFGSQDLFLSTMAQPPTYSPYLADGSGRYAFKAYDFELNNKNPIAIINEKVFNNDNDYTIETQGWIEFQLTKDLKWYTKAALNLAFDKSTEFSPVVPLYNFRTNQYATTLDTGVQGLTVKDDQNVYKNIYSYLSYDKLFGVHKVFFQAGFSSEDNTEQYLSGYRKEFPNNILRQLDAGSASVQTTNGSKYEWAIQSLFGRIDYNFKEKYLLEANLRYDGTSRLYKSNRWGTFPSFSAGWRLTEEQFIKNMSMNWLDNIKIRGSYGILGNQNIGLYPYQAIISLTNNYSFDNSTLSTGAAQTALNNQNIKWESTKILDYGLDMSIFNSLSVTFDWYKKTTSDILRSSQVSGVVGLNPPTVNDGIMQNTGVELSVNYQKSIKSGILNGLNYNLGINLDHYKNKLVKFGAKEINGYYLLEEGQEWNTFYMLEQTGIFQNQEQIATYPKQYNDATVPGDLIFKDTNGDKVVNDADRVVIKGRYPDLNYSFNGSVNWKGFDLYTMFQGVYGVKYFINNWGSTPFVQGSPPTVEWRNRWTEANPSMDMPRIYWGWNAPAKYSRNSTYFLQDGSYLRLKNLTIGYSIPDKVLKKYGLTKLRIYLSGDNLLTFTPYPGLDPERGGSGNAVNYPQNKIYSMGINVNF